MDMEMELDAARHGFAKMGFGCKFFDDDVDKEQYHCKDCGICRVGGKDNFFHCHKCGSCYSVTLRDKHVCIEDSMKNNCPICYEYLFDSLREASVLRCGHTMHLQCFHEMLKHDKFTCPMCSVSIFDMEKFLRALDAEIEAKFLHMGKGWIVCNHCWDTTRVYPGMTGQRKCCHCQSYNTCRVAPSVLPA
ncbi:unnamed protein product [Triticum turgidum subsp. durum]|uniref:Uncharacterized protein n=1 Tax=Triticum turgidum subsp. durum TaxID=4567 RepID=A0A9R0W0U9_TRITD|nr:unnamed protein product [Triticum turgidum subsp. durum]